MNSKNDFLWQMPLWHVLFLCPSAGPAAGSGTLSKAGSKGGVRHFVRGGVRHFARDGIRPLCPRWGQAPLPAAGSGPLPEMGSGTLPEAGPDPIGDCDISALALYSALFYNSWCW